MTQFRKFEYQFTMTEHFIRVRTHRRYNGTDIMGLSTFRPTDGVE